MKYLFHTFLFLALSAGFFSCDDLDLTLEENQAEEVTGLWEGNRTNGNNTFVLISNTEFNFYEYNASLECVVTEAYRVIHRDGTGFFQVDQGDDTPVMVFAVSNLDDRLRIRFIDDPDADLEYYWPSERDITSIPECINETDIQGKWEFTRTVDTNDETTYVDIKDSSITVYSEFSFEECFDIVTYKIDGRTGNIYKLIDQISDDITAELFVELKRTQDGLEITLEEDEGTNTDLYTASTVDFSTLSPNCGNSFPSGFEGIWEFETNMDATNIQLHMELKQDTLRYYSKVVEQGCTDIKNHLVHARRGDTFFLSNPDSEFIDLIYQVFFDQNVLVTRITQGTSTFDERFVRSATTLAELESNLCTSGF